MPTADARTCVPTATIAADPVASQSRQTVDLTAGPSWVQACAIADSDLAPKFGAVERRLRHWL